MSPTALRAAVLTAGLALALLSRGDVIVLAVLLAVGARGPLRAVAVVAALKATAWRWTSSSLEHVAAAQSVLGPAGFVDPPSSAASSWLAGAAILLATPTLPAPRSPERWSRLGARWLPPAAFAATAGVVVAGPSASDGAAVRLLAFGLALGATVVLQRISPLARSVGAVACGAGSLVAAAVDTPPLVGILDLGAFLEGLAIAGAVGVLSWVLATALRHRHAASGPQGMTEERA